MRGIITFFILGLIGVSAYFFFFWNGGDASVSADNLVESNAEAVLPTVEVKQDRIERIEIVDGSTFGALMTEAGIDYGTTMEILEVAEPVYDLVKVRVGRFLELVFDAENDNFKELVYQVDSEEKLHVVLVESQKSKVKSGNDNDEDSEIGDLKLEIEGDERATSTNQSEVFNSESKMVWSAELRTIEYEVRQRAVSGVIESSLYQSALDNNIDERAIIELANAFQWTIDFAMDPREGDTYKFIFEERYLDGEYVMPGSVLAGEYVNMGVKFSVYYFEESEDNKGYFDENGNSVQKMFLKAPVEFRYISSGFTTGPRYVAQFQVYNSSHMAIDYAAALGTPIRAVGDGVVTFAGWNSSGYGNLTKIRHNSTYSTNYAHQSRFAAKTGQRVKQGDIIGYVGSTGFSTGPHLHYEMVKNGVKVNPLKEVLPPGEPILEENKERFFEEIKKYQDEMDKL